MGIAVVGVASTIDNNLAGSDTTIGVDTALNVALEAIDRLKTNGVLTPAGIFSSK
jgi:6-phosphofructokinase 1